MTMYMTNRLPVTAAIFGLLAFPLLSNAQTDGGYVKRPSAAELAQRIAAAQAGFGTVLSEALSPANIKSLTAAAKNAPESSPYAYNVTFDNVVAPCDFSATSALRGVEQLAAFGAPGNNGGAILNECGNFGLEAHSPPNFLAFNNAVTYTDGGVPELPQIIFFGTAKTSVSLWVSGGDGAGYPIGIVAFGEGVLQGVTSTITTSTWQQVTVTGAAIDGIDLVGNAAFC